MSSVQELIDELLDLSHILGSPKFDWAILGEGNTSARIDETKFLVKASGSQLATLTAEQLAQVLFDPILNALDDHTDYSDAAVKELLSSSTIPAGASVPSVETILHAYLLTLPDVDFVGHTHVTSINSLLCSSNGWEAISRGGRLFPDEIVVCGIAPCCVPYVDPGLPLARKLKERVEWFIEKYGVRPKTVYLQNHGFIALGTTAQEVVSITKMADKCACIMLGAFASGGPTFLTPANVQRIATRPDEHQRQRALGLNVEYK
jgi:rhamnose utilization protein RhaD (predicted bifunctional aldolase and dehydrogenase)